MDFYPTIRTAPETAKRFHVNGVNQRECILQVFKKNPLVELTPFDVFRMFNDRWPITSIRRAMTDLTALGQLEKLPRMREERLGKPNCLWRLNRKRKQHQIKLWG